jgi:imidazolonepropionase-like amidohydrolase
MGNVAGYRKAFEEAVEYQRKWDTYRRKLALWEVGESSSRRDGAAPPKRKRGKPAPAAKPDEKQRPEPPARDFGLETLAGVLDGDILVHMHCYRADEMSLMLEFAAGYGFSIRSFHHAVEAYKIADRLAANDTAVSIWADWWGFKVEAYDGVRENAAMVTQAGARAIIHSDSATGIQRLNQEAGKALFAGRKAGVQITDEQALEWLTINPAWALGVDDRTGSLEPGKAADIVVWTGDPFSVYTQAQLVFIDGELVYERGPDSRPRSDFDLGLRDELRGAP